MKINYIDIRYQSHPLQVPLRRWQRRIRQSLESRKEKVQNYVRHEGNVKSANRKQKVSKFRHQRAKASCTTETPVSLLLEV